MSDVEAFWERVQQGPSCWEWQKTLDKDGYGQWRFRGRLRKAHRISWELHNGAIESGQQIDHKCRNRRCVNPTHLRLVTHKQNQENKPLEGGGVSGVRGVYWDKRCQKWKAQAYSAGTCYYGGTYATVQEAAEAVQQLRRRIHTHNEADRQQQRS